VGSVCAMRIRIHPDVAKLVNERRKTNKRSANQEVNIALAMHYSHWVFNPDNKPKKK
jgi:hypothetical protein